MTDQSAAAPSISALDRAVTLASRAARAVVTSARLCTSRSRGIRAFDAAMR